MSSHIDYAKQLSPHAVTPDEWLQPAARMTKYLNDLAGRSDLSTTVGPGVGLGNPACFLPWRGEIRVDTAVCLQNTDPEDINPADALWRLEHPVFMGATGHEAAHAAHTRWTVSDFEDTGKIKAKHIDVIMLLEEPRCEHRLLQHTPGQKLFLRATALDLILKDFEIPRTTYGAAGIAALVLGRVDARSLEKMDGRAVHAAVAPVLGDKLPQLQELWKEFLQLGDLHISGMYSVARRWLEVLEEDPDGTDGLIFGSQPDPDAENAGPGDWIRSAVGSAAVAVDSVVIEKRAGERVRRRMAAAEADADRRSRGAKAAHEAYNPDSGTTAAATAHRTGERAPTEDEQRAATGLSRALLLSDNQSVPDIGRTTRTRPPGRLRSREAAQAAAYSALDLRGRRPEMFRARQLSPEERSPLAIALMLDISGSMMAAEQAISSTHWVLSHAGHRAGARVAAVHFGAVVHGVARPGQIDAMVQEYDCSDPWENFKDAFLAADHTLNLLDGPGARLLVIASDGQYRRGPQMQYAESAMTLCRQKGVAVIWLKLTRKLLTNYGFGTVLDMEGAEPVEIAVAVGTAAVKQMERLK